MKGLMITVGTDEKTTHQELNRYPTLEELQKGIGGGYIELIPGFTTYTIGGKSCSCQAFCDEDGKSKNLRYNMVATDLWNTALVVGRRFPTMDLLRGPVVILLGDQEFFDDGEKDGED